MREANKIDGILVVMDIAESLNLTEKIKNPIALTSRAAQQVKKIIEEEQIPPHHYLRVAVKGGGCSGLSYSLGFDEKTDNDELFETESIEVVVDKRHILYLHGISIDFHDGLDARGFVFNNPNATSTCGCGTSFSA